MRTVLETALKLGFEKEEEKKHNEIEFEQEKDKERKNERGTQNLKWEKVRKEEKRS